MKKRNETVQIKQIAEKLQLSSSTVSIVLSGRGDEMRISKTTQELVQKVAQEMNYYSNSYAKRVKEMDVQKSRFVVGVFLNIATAEQRVQGIHKGLWKSRENQHYIVEYVLEFFEYDNLERYGRNLNTTIYDGALLIGVSERDIDYLNRQPLELPVVVMNVPGEGFSSIYVDEYQVGRACASLFSTAGIVRTGVISQEYKMRGPGMRMLGFLQACKEYGITLKEQWNVVVKDRTFECGMQAMQQILDQGERPQAVFVMSDTAALGAAYALKEKKIAIPEEMALMCYGDNRLLEVMKPTISCVRFFVEEMVEEAIKLLISLSEGKVRTSIARIKTADFVFRESFPDPRE